MNSKKYYGFSAFFFALAGITLFGLTNVVLGAVWLMMGIIFLLLGLLTKTQEKYNK